MENDTDGCSSHALIRYGNKFLYTLNEDSSDPMFPGGNFTKSDFGKFRYGMGKKSPGLTDYDVSKEVLKRELDRQLNPDFLKIGKYLGIRPFVQITSAKGDYFTSMYFWEAKLFPEDLDGLKARSRKHLMLLDLDEARGKILSKKMIPVLNYFYSFVDEWGNIGEIDKFTEYTYPIREMRHPESPFRRSAAKA